MEFFKRVAKQAGAVAEKLKAKTKAAQKQESEEGLVKKAVAQEQEMVALEQEMRARVVEAEADVPRAMAEALREGKLGVMDYYNMQNLQADTAMRKSISVMSDPTETEK